MYLQSAGGIRPQPVLNQYRFIHSNSAMDVSLYVNKSFGVWCDVSKVSYPGIDDIDKRDFGD